MANVNSLAQPLTFSKPDKDEINKYLKGKYDHDKPGTPSLARDVAAGPVVSKIDDRTVNPKERLDAIVITGKKVRSLLNQVQNDPESARYLQSILDALRAEATRCAAVVNAGYTIRNHKKFTPELTPENIWFVNESRSAGQHLAGTLAGGATVGAVVLGAIIGSSDPESLRLMVTGGSSAVVGLVAGSWATARVLNPGIAYKRPRARVFDASIEASINPQDLLDQIGKIHRQFQGHQDRYQVMDAVSVLEEDVRNELAVRRAALAVGAEQTITTRAIKLYQKDPNAGVGRFVIDTKIREAQARSTWRDGDCVELKLNSSITSLTQPAAQGQPAGNP